MPAKILPGYRPLHELRRLSCVGGPGSKRIEVGLKYGLRGQAIHVSAPLRAREAAAGPEPLGLPTRETFVHQMHRKTRVFPEQFSERHCLFGLGAKRIVHVYRQSDHDFLDLLLGDDRAQMGEVLLGAFAIQGLQAVGHETKAVADGQAEAALAVIDSEDAWLFGRMLHGFDSAAGFVSMAAEQKSPTRRQAGPGTTG